MKKIAIWMGYCEVFNGLNYKEKNYMEVNYHV